jgi:arylsulfatase
MAGYPRTYNIEMDLHEDLNVGGLFGWAGEPALEAVMKYKKTLKQYPNPLGANLTKF